MHIGMCIDVFNNLSKLKPGITQTVKKGDLSNSECGIVVEVIGECFKVAARQQ